MFNDSITSGNCVKAHYQAIRRKSYRWLTKPVKCLNIEQMDESLFKEFLSKNSVWDFHNMTRDEYTAKSNNEKELLVLKFYKEMVKGKI